MFAIFNNQLFFSTYLIFPKIQVDVLDVNDNGPTFKDKEYSVVLLENVPVGSSVVNVSATDPDIGLAGFVMYEIVNEFDNFGG